LLKNADCASFIKSALEQAKTDTGRSQHGTTDILKLFDAVKAGRGFDYRTMTNAQARGGGGPGYASISINPINAFADLSNISQSVSRGQILIHELFHVGGYDHDAMARAAYNLGERFDASWKAWKGEFPDPESDNFFPLLIELKGLTAPTPAFLEMSCVNIANDGERKNEIHCSGCICTAHVS
jgi:hypothetical protein